MAKRRLVMWMLAFVMTTGVFTIRDTVKTSQVRFDAAGIGGDWWTDLILEIHNYREMIRTLHW